MAHAIEMFLDLDADRAVRAWWRELSALGLPSLETRTHRQHRPHVSLTVMTSAAHLDLSHVRQVLAGSELHLRLASVGVFPGPEGVLFLGVVVTPELLALHRELHQCVAPDAVELWPYYEPGLWVPHCTLALGLDDEQCGTAVRALRTFQPVEARVVAVGLTDTTTGAVVPLAESGVDDS